jgi:hypothetical protein
VEVLFLAWSTVDEFSNAPDVSGSRLLLLTMPDVLCSWSGDVRRFFGGRFL